MVSALTKNKSYMLFRVVSMADVILGRYMNINLATTNLSNACFPNFLIQSGADFLAQVFGNTGHLRQ